jgi:hypothetical protein
MKLCNKRIVIVSKEGRKEGSKKGRKEGGKEGRKEGRKEGSMYVCTHLHGAVQCFSKSLKVLDSR